MPEAREQAVSGSGIGSGRRDSAFHQDSLSGGISTKEECSGTGQPKSKTKQNEQNPWTKVCDSPHRVIVRMKTQST